MRLFLWALGLAGAVSLATVASATTCASDTWCFGSNPEQVGDNTTYSSSLGGITVFSEQITNSSSGGTYLSSSNSTINGLFSTNDSVFDEGIGIAPYNPVEGNGSSFSSQDGLTDVVATNNHGGTNSNIGNIIVLELGSNIAQGTSLSFLLQAGIGASGDAVTAYWADTTNPNVSPSSMTKFATTTDGQISTNGTTPQFSITKNTSGVEFIAIEADCHYLLLDTIGGTPSAAPEPRFYGLLLAGLLGIAGMVYQKRRAAQVNA
jgi:hypothetical protein